jgi:hypothetical protein
MDTSKLESSGLVGDSVVDHEVCLDGIEGNHEKFYKTTYELKSTTNELVKDQKALSNMTEEMFAFMK